MKFFYHLSINQCHGSGVLTFSYGQTKEIKMFVNSRGASFKFQTGKTNLENFEHSYIRNLVKEGIKRAGLLYLLENQKPLNIRNITLSVSRGRKISQSIDLTNSLVFYHMFDGKLLRPISSEWRMPEIQQRLLEYRKTWNELSGSVAALYAYLFSKTKNKETERFSYLWIAMNGFYASISSINKDRYAMNSFLGKYNIGKTTLPGREREKVCKPAIFELMKVPEPVTKENLEDNDHKSFSDFIRSKVSEYDSSTFDLTPYGFLLTDFPYYLRCTLFHAAHPIELFSFESDWELKSLRIVNSLLEDFLDHHLFELFLRD